MSNLSGNIYKQYGTRFFVYTGKTFVDIAGGKYITCFSGLFNFLFNDSYSF